LHSQAVLEREHALERLVAARVAHSTQELLGGYAEMVGRLNDTFVAWEDALGMAERRHHQHALAHS
jgi:hypothetical protein